MAKSRAAPIPTPMPSAMYHFFSSSLSPSSRATLSSRALSRSSRRGSRRRSPRGSRVSRGRLEGQEHLPAVSPLSSPILAQGPKDGLGEEGTLLQVLEISRHGRGRERFSLHRDLVARNLQRREPHQVRESLGHLVHEPDRPLLVGLQVVD